MNSLTCSVFDEDMEQIAGSPCVDFRQMQGKTLLVTGATGLVGSVIVKAVLKYNYGVSRKINICIIARDEQKVKKTFGDDFTLQGIDVVYADLNDDISIDKNIDYIIHCACNTNSGYMVTNPVETLGTAYMGTDRILKLAYENKVQSVVYVSSMEVYGITKTEDNPVTEEKLGYIDIHNVRSSYSEGKRVCELLCSSYASEYGVPVKIARLAQTFGAGVPFTDTRVFAQFARSVIEKKDIILHTKGNSAANFCYIADVVEGILCILTRGKNGEAYNIVNEAASMKIHEAAQLVSSELGKGNIKVVFDIPENNHYGYAPDTMLKLSGEKIRELGWKPHYSLTQMYERLIEYWVDQQNRMLKCENGEGKES